MTLATSDRSATVDHSWKSLSSAEPLADVRLQTVEQAASSFREAAVSESAWGGTGRPRAIESQRRRHEFLRLLAAGKSWREAAREARIKPDTVLTMLDQPEFRTVVKALLDGRADVAAVTVAPEEALAA